MSSAAARLEGYTLEDWESLEPREGYRIELVNGRFVVTGGRSKHHQRTADRLYRVLDDAVAPFGLEAITAIGVRVGQRGYVPDVVVCSPQDAETISAETVTLVVEVVSPSTTRADRLEKPAAYAAAGIPAYWRVEQFDTEAPVVTCYALDGDVYREVAVARNGNPVEVAITKDISVKLDVDALAVRRR